MEELLGSPVPEKYDTIVTVCTLLVLFYGADYLYKKFMVASESNRVKDQLDGLVGELAEATGKQEDDIKRVLKDRYTGNRLRRIGRAASRFFKPSKRQGNATIKVGSRRIQKDVLTEIPGNIGDESLEPRETSQQFFDVDIELHAQDMDYAKRWAAVIPSVSSERMKMHVFPPVQPEDIYTRQHIRGDVIVVFKEKDGNYHPTQFHLIRLTG